MCELTGEYYSEPTLYDKHPQQAIVPQRGMNHMTLEIEPDKARERIDEFLEQIDELLEKSYKEGKDEKRSMNTKLDNFAKIAFSDGEDKIDGLYPSVTSATFGGRDPTIMQREYEDSLKRKKRHLEAWKEQIELEEGGYTDTRSADGSYDEIRDEISKINEELPIYADDLEQSIDELTSGHLLASVMITGRVIDHTLDQIKSSQRLGGPEEVLEHLKENDIIDPREGKITDSIKSYRDVYAHEVGKKPDLHETIIILMGCAKLLHNIQEAGKSREYDLA